MSCPISSSAESDQEASDNDGVNGRGEEARRRAYLLKSKLLVLHNI